MILCSFVPSVGFCTKINTRQLLCSSPVLLEHFGCSSVFILELWMLSYDLTDIITWFNWCSHMVQLNICILAHDTNKWTQLKHIQLYRSLIQTMGGWISWNILWKNVHSYHIQQIIELNCNWYLPRLTKHTTNNWAQLQLVVAKAHKTVARAHRVTKWLQELIIKSFMLTYLTLPLRPWVEREMKRIGMKWDEQLKS